MLISFTILIVAILGPCAAAAQSAAKEHIMLGHDWQQAVEVWARDKQAQRPDAFVAEQGGFRAEGSDLHYWPMSEGFRIPLRDCPEAQKSEHIWDHVATLPFEPPANPDGCRVEIRLESELIASQPEDDALERFDASVFFNAQDYPGIRVVPNDPVRLMTLALVADGVAAEAAAAALETEAGRARALAVIDGLKGNLMLVDDDAAALQVLTDRTARFAIATEAASRDGERWRGTTFNTVYDELAPWVSYGEASDVPIEWPEVQVDIGKMGQGDWRQAADWEIAMAPLGLPELPAFDSGIAMADPPLSHVAMASAGPGADIGLSVALDDAAAAAVEGAMRSWFEDNPAEFHQARVEVFFATTRRNVAAEGDMPSFGGEHNVGSTSSGVVEVLIPDTYETGEDLEIPWGEKVWNFFTGQTPPEFEIEDIRADTLADHLTRVAGADATGQAFVYVHGYRTTFDFAALTAGKLAFDIRHLGLVPMMFSWASGGKFAEYGADEDKIEAAEPAFRSFLEEALDDPRIETLHFVAHSMGSRLVLETLRDMREAQDPRLGKVGAVIFAAADVSVDIFNEKYDEIFIGDDKVSATFYLSDSDTALWFSGNVHFNDRVGRLGDGTLRLPNIEMIDVSDHDDGFWGHKALVMSHSLIRDVGIFARDRLPAMERGSMRRHPDSRWADAVFLLSGAR